jgi:hypothetical protein
VIRHLGRRVLASTSVIASLMGVVAFVSVNADPRLWSQVEPRASLWFVVGLALSTAPLSAFLAATWTWLSLRTSGQLANLEASGHDPARLRLFVATSVALVLLGAALATEVFLPLARNSAGARLSWELQSRRPTAFFSGEDRLVVRAGVSLDRLADVWRWRDGSPAHLEALRWDGATWRQEGTEVPGLPSPLQLVAARPGLFELLTISELMTLGGEVRWKERLLRPVFWLLWIACALAALSRWRAPTLPSVLALGFLLVAGVTLQSLTAELAFGASTALGQWAALALAPATAAFAGWAVRGSRRPTLSPGE